LSVPLPMTAEPGEPMEPGDAELIEAVRAGDVEAYGLLYRRHAAAATGLARQLVGSRAEADDLVAEAFAKVLDVLRGGGGPDAAFRAYLLTTLRNTLYDRSRRDRKLEWSEDMTRHDPGVPWEDTAVAALENSLAARAFHRLPERWQTVLWHTEVEQESPAEVAPLLGLTPNGVAALAYRAREGLRQAYLQEHVADGVGREHEETVNRLGAWARGGLTPRQRARVQAHLATCADCRALAGELEDVNAGLRGVIAPLILGSAAATYLATHAAPPAAAAAAGAAGGAAGGAAVHGAAAGQGLAAGGAAGQGAAGGAAGQGAAGGAAGQGLAAGGAAGQGAAAGGGAAGGAAGHGAAVGGAAAQGAAAGGAAGGAAAGGGGSVLGSVAAWVAGTHAGQAAAAAIAAVVIGGTALVATTEGGGSPDTPAVAATTTPTAGLPGPSEPGATASGAPPASGAVSATPTPSTGGRTASGSPAPGQEPGASGSPPAPGGSDGPSPSAGGRPSTPPGATPGPGQQPAGPTRLVVGPPTALGILRVGSPGDVTVTIRNSGAVDATGVVATLRLPAGLTAQGGSGSGGWGCTAGAIPTCTLDQLDQGEETTVQVRVDVAASAVPGGTVTGTLRTENGPSVGIPSRRLTVEP
jgi:RNA polymerase sigma factor (sigma-70 family)